VYGPGMLGDDWQRTGVACDLVPPLPR
jgi:hypothetical protein